MASRPLRLLHTSDWHLGHSFYGSDREYEHGCFLNWLLEVLQAETIDVLLIAGDIFDTVNPPLSAQRLWYDFIARVQQQCPGLQVIAIAGNHDSGMRLELPAPLLTSLHTHVVGRVQWQAAGQLAGDSLRIALHDRSGTCRGYCIALPYLRPAELTASGLSQELPEAIAHVHQQLVEDTRQQLASQNVPGVLVMLSHAHVQGALTSADSERPITIGNAEGLPASLYPDDAQYVALGHLHRPQSISACDHMRYSGSPIPLSFSELHYRHQVVLVDCVAGQPGAVRTLTIPRTVGMHRIRGALPEVLQQLSMLTPATKPLNQRDWIDVSIISNLPLAPDIRQQLAQALPEGAGRIVRIRRELPDRASLLASEPHSTDCANQTATTRPAPTPMSLFQSLWREQNGVDDEAVYADFMLLLDSFYGQQANEDTP